jgi:hypothetical protein
MVCFLQVLLTKFYVCCSPLGVISAAHLITYNLITHMYFVNNTNYEADLKCFPQCPACKRPQSLFLICETKFHTHT